LEEFACDFIKAVCGEQIDARLSGIMAGQGGRRAIQKGEEASLSTNSFRNTLGKRKYHTKKPSK